MIAPDNPVERLAGHLVGTRFEDLPAPAIAKAKTFLLDTLGVGIAGSSGAGRDLLINTVSGWGAGDEARVWLSGERLPAQSAAIINAFQIHCLEYDCVHEGAVVHPMATILSAVIAHAERRARAGRPVTGRDLLLALVLGVDVATVLGMAATGPIRFFRPATCGGFGAVAALAKLEGFDRETIKNGFGAVYGQTSGTLQAHAEGSMLLPLQIGFNARAALTAVDLAGAGVRAPHDVITGQYGYLPLFENGAFDVAPAFDQLGEVWQITRLSHKPFPSGRLTHGVVDALMRLARDGIGPEAIAQVRCEVPPLVHRLVGRPDVPAPEANYAKLCLPFVAGVFLARGRVDVPDFRGDAMLTDPVAHDFAKRVEVVRDDNPDENALDPQRFVVTLTDGTQREVVLPCVYGHPDAPLSEAENVAKFRRCVSYGRSSLGAAAVDDLIRMVADLEGVDDVAELVSATVVAG